MQIKASPPFSPARVLSKKVWIQNVGGMFFNFAKLRVVYLVNLWKPVVERSTQIIFKRKYLDWTK